MDQRLLACPRWRNKTGDAGTPSRYTAAGNEQLALLRLGKYDRDGNELERSPVYACRQLGAAAKRRLTPGPAPRDARARLVMPVTLLDIILLGVMLISALLAMIRGFMREVLSIAAWVIAALVTLYSYSQAAAAGEDLFQQRHRRGRGRDRRRVSRHLADRVGDHRAVLRHGARQPRRRARPHARVPVRARARTGHRGGGVPVFRLAGAASAASPNGSAAPSRGSCCREPATG